MVKTAQTLLVGLVLIGATAGAQSARQPGQLFERFDSNRDGVIDEQEIRNERRSMFKSADENGDDYVSDAELEALKEKVRSAAPGRGRGLRGRASAQGAGDGAEDRLERLDADDDGRISEAEFLAGPSPLQRFDRDADGRVTRVEMDQGRAEILDELRERRRVR